MAHHFGHCLSKLARPIGLRPDKDPVAGGFERFPRVTVVHYGKARNHAGLDRKQLQQSFAEGMDGLDLESARGFQGAGEEAARQTQIVG